MNIEQKIREYLPQIIHMSLATCFDGQPWVCEVHYVFDDELNLYFRSKPERRHSLEIAKNNNVAGNIVTQHFKDQSVRGVYFEGKAQLLENIDQYTLVHELFYERFGKDSSIVDEAKREDGHKFYKIEVDKFYLFDSYESTPSQKYELEWKNK